MQLQYSHFNSQNSCKSQDFEYFPPLSLYLVVSSNQVLYHYYTIIIIIVNVISMDANTDIKASKAALSLAAVKRVSVEDFSVSFVIQG